MTPITIEIDICVNYTYIANTSPNKNTIDKFNQLLEDAKEIKRISNAKQQRKKYIEKLMDNLVIKMLSNPMGISKRDILLESEDDNLLGTIISLNAHLKHENKYKLKKRKHNKEWHYYLDPIR